MKLYTLLGFLAQLDNLNLEELLKVKQKVDKIIESKTLNTVVAINNEYKMADYTITKHPAPNNFQVIIEGSDCKATFISGFAQDIDIVVSPGKQVNNQNDMQAMESMIALVSEWLQDESGYDEEVYPNIEAALIPD
jgi:hypothetical protein